MQTDAVHRKGCTRQGVRPSVLMPGYRFCPGCRRMIKEE